MNGSIIRTLAVIDMQYSECPATEPWIIEAVSRQIELAAENQWPVVMIWFDDMPVIWELKQLLESKGVEHVFVRKKNWSGAGELVAACAENGFPTHAFRVCGVCALKCVANTVLGLSRMLPEAEIEVIAEACNDEGKIDWKKFPRNANVFIR